MEVLLYVKAKYVSKEYTNVRVYVCVRMCLCGSPHIHVCIMAYVVLYVSV